MLLEIKDLDKTYSIGVQNVKALTNINISIENGEFTALCGPSGSGKTTLLNIIGCIDSYDSGDLILEGVNLKKKTSDELAFLRREYFGFVFQTYNLIPVLSVYENVELPLKLLGGVKENIMKERIMACLEKVGLKGLEKRKPMELSGGQQQRVSIARAIVKNPKIILADEPTANLDSVTGKNIIDLMREMNEKDKITFLFSTHDGQIMNYAKKVINMRDGIII